MADDVLVRVNERQDLAGLFSRIKRHVPLILVSVVLFAIPLVFILPHFFGEPGIWMGAPAADIGMLGLIAIVLAANASRRGWRFGVLQPV